VTRGQGASRGPGAPEGKAEEALRSAASAGCWVGYQPI
jgi:hypothetical protein